MRPLQRLRPYPGAKGRDAEEYLKRIDALRHGANTLISPFLGCGNVEARVPVEWFGYTIVNDIDDLITSFFLTLQNWAEFRNLLHMLQNTVASKAMLDRSSELLLNSGSSHAVRAWAWLVRGLLTHSKTPADCPAPQLAVIAGSPGGNNPGRRIRQAAQICRDWRDAVLERDWQITNMDALELMRDLAGKPHAKKYVWFLDPPYHPETCDPSLYKHGMTAEQSSRFLEVVASLPGAVILCGYRHHDIDRLLDVGYRVDEFEAMAEGKGLRREAIYWIEADTPRGQWAGVTQGSLFEFHSKEIL